MMITKHTPGPWAVGQYTPTTHFLAIDNHSCVCDPKTMALIATCGRADDRQSQVDADLIAAAPDLLAACEKAAICIDEGDDVRGTLEMLCAAIAKANGETP